MKVKNASMAPKSIKATRADIGEEGVVTIEIIAIASELMVTTEPASPSIPSIKLIAFVIPTIHKRLIGYDKIPSSISFPKGLNIVSILTPRRITVVAIVICKNSLNFAFKQNIAYKGIDLILFLIQAKTLRSRPL